MANLKALQISFGASFAQLDKDLSTLEKKLQATGAQLQNVGKTLSVAVTAPLTALGFKAVSLWDKQAKAIANVEAGLKSTGGTVGYTSGQLQKMASDLQATSLFGDEDILQGVTAQLLTFTNIAGEQFKKTQQSAIDLAAKMKGDLQGASIMLGKALNDPVSNLSALSRAGIQFSDDQEKVIKSLQETGRLADAQTIILEELEKQFGGTAEAAARAGTGPIQQLGMAFGDLLEDFGAIIAQGLIPLADHVKTAVGWFKGLDDTTKKLIVVAGSLAASIGPILFGIGSLIKLLPVLKTGLLAVQGAMGPVGLAAIALGTAATLIIANWDTIAPFMVELWGKLRSTFSTAIGLLLNEVAKFVGIFSDDWAKSIKDAGDRMIQNAGEVLTESRAAAAGMREEAKKTADEQKKQSDGAADAAAAAAARAAAEQAAAAAAAAAAQKEAAEDSAKAWEKAMQASEKAVRNFHHIGPRTMQEAVDSMIAQTERQRRAMEQMAAAARGALRTIPEATEKEMEAVEKEVAAARFPGSFGELIGQMKGHLSNLGRDFGSVFEAVTNGFKGQGGLFGVLKSFGEGGIGGIVSKITGQGGLLSALTGPGGIGGAITGLMSAAGPWGAALSGGLKLLDMFGIDVKGAIGKVVDKVFGAVKSAASAVGSFIGGIFGGGTDNTGDSVAGGEGSVASFIDRLNDTTDAESIAAAERLQGVTDPVKVIQELFAVAGDTELSGSEVDDIFHALGIQARVLTPIKRGWSASRIRSAVGLAEGGIVMPRVGGVFANLAERGEAEVVSPLSKLPGLMASIMPRSLNLSGAGGLGGRSFEQHIVVMLDGYPVARASAKHLPDFLKLEGLA